MCAHAGKGWSLLYASERDAPAFAATPPCVPCRRRNPDALVLQVSEAPFAVLAMLTYVPLVTATDSRRVAGQWLHRRARRRLSLLLGTGSAIQIGTLL